MIRWIVGSSAKARVVVAALGGAIMLVGATQLRHTKVDGLPEFGPPTVEVHTEALGLSAAEVEQLITVPLEQDLLDGVAWLAAIHSESLPGLSSIEMVFEPGTNLLRARQVVQERISQAAGLPQVSGPPQMLQPESSTSRVMMIGLSSQTVSPIEMSVLARWTVRPRLLGVPGVANVAIWGQRERQLQVQVDPERLRTFGISLHQVIETAGNALWASPLTFLEANTPGTGGCIDTQNQRLCIQHLQPIRTAGDLASVPIEDRTGTRLRLSEVARVVEDHQLLIGDAVLTGGPGLLLVIEKSPGANTLEVTRGVEAALDALRPGLTGIRVDPTIYRPATYLETSRHNVAIALAIGLFLLILGLGALFFDWRTTLVSVAAVTLSLIAAGLVLRIRGVTVNAMVLAGLLAALGVVIDDAIVDVERMARRLRDHRLDGDGDGESPAKLILGPLTEMRSAAVFAALVVVMAVLPFFFLRGQSGAFFPPLVLSFLLAVGVSMAVALTVTPVLTLILLSRAPLERRGSPLAGWVQSGYDRTLRGALGRPGIVYGATAAMLAVGVAALPFVRGTVLPSFRDSDVVVQLSAAPGTSLPEMDRLTRRVTAEVRSIAGVTNVAAHVGRAITSDQVVSVDSAQLWVAIDHSADHDATVASIRRAAGGYPGVDVRLLTYPNERVANVFTQADQPIVVRVFGQDLRILDQKAHEIGDAISRIEGVANPRVQPLFEEPTVEIKVDLGAAKSYGIKPGDVRRAAATLISGLSVGSLFDEQKVFDVVAWGVPGVRHSLTSIRNLLIDTPGGGHVRLDKVADVHIASTPPVIRHNEVSRSLDVTADVRGRSVGAVLDDVRRRLGAVEFPLEYHAEMVGDYSERRADLRRLLSVLVAAAIGVFLLLQAAFRSWRLATISFVTLPIALAGGSVAGLFGGRTVSVGSAAGFIAVFAIAVRGSVTLIRHYQHLEEGGGVAAGKELILRGSRERLVPIVMTAFTAGLALLPLVVSVGVAGEELLHPMAAVVLGGLITSTLLNLFVMPVLCARFGSSPVTEPATSQPVAVLPEVEPAPVVLSQWRAIDEST